ncbi:hypothetical protein [Devosia sp.]|uniref:hypothetical protein n=1 Tax=Devosia sp. TaxID=1871048 RepID=UPI00292ED0FF|nr:hypothetical protein [Devosia sp.]
MKHFLALYIGSVTSREKARWDADDDASRQRRMMEGGAAWSKWAAGLGDAIVDQGTPLGRTLRISPDGIAPTQNACTAYVIVQAETHEAAAEMFRSHPHFTLMPGDSVEVMACLPMPAAPT